MDSWSVLGFTLLSIVSMCLAKICTEANIEYCIDAVDSYGITYSPLPVIIGELGYDKICSEVETMDACLSSLTTTCTEEEKSIFEGVHEPVNYICGQGSTAYNESYDCLLLTEMKRDVIGCNETYTAAIQGASSTGTCSVFTTFLDCVESASSEHCDSEIAGFLTEYNRLIIQPKARSMNCDLTGAASSRTRITPVLVIGISVALSWILMHVN